MRNKFIIILIASLFLFGCVGVASKGIFGTGVSVALDPRSLGTQIDDSIMQKNLSARLVLMDKKYLLIHILALYFIACEKELDITDFSDDFSFYNLKNQMILMI